jgi:7,8-dihydro-6-hydroxymethylpterin-pyrophosphokinase
VSGSADEALGKAEELLERLKAMREELERLAAEENAEAAVDVLTELAELAKDVEAELGRARALAENAPRP